LSSSVAQRRYYLWNIGCQMNRADADRLAEALEARGYHATRDPADADLMLLNTCVVRQSAEDKVIGRLHSLRPLKTQDGSKALLVMGCLVDDPAALAQRFDFVDGFFAPSDISGVLSFVAQRDAEAEARPLTAASAAQVSEFVPISYGCDHHCTYCLVTLRRGDQRSRPVAEIAAEAASLVARGAREITLLGQNVDAYGSDLPERPDLADILRAIHAIEDLWRIRFLTSHPHDMTQRIIDTVAALPKVCPCWELAMQSGDDAVLRRMGRGYTVAAFLDLVRRIRAATPDCTLNTDIIVGFPGETEGETLSVMEEVRYDSVFSFCYSPRPGTRACGMRDRVDPAEGRERLRRLQDLQGRHGRERLREAVGREFEVLVEGPSAKDPGELSGRTPCYKMVNFMPRGGSGPFRVVRVVSSGAHTLSGEER